MYNKGVSTILILDNSITAMTGHQDNPATGRTIKGEIASALDLVALVKATGIHNVRVIDPFNLKDSEIALKEEIERDEPSVIIFKRPCALLDKSQASPLRINSEKCTSCGLCLRLGCPAIQKKDDGMVINDALCNGCRLCIQVCRFNAMEGVDY